MIAAIIAAGIAATLGAAGSIVGGVMSYQDSQNQADIADFNAKLAQRNAEQANLNAAASEARANSAADAEQNEYMRKEQLAREESAKRRSLNLAIAGESGVSATGGSSLLVNVDNAVNEELNALDIRRVGENSANNIRYQGQLNAFEQRLQSQSYMGEAQGYKMQSQSIRSNGMNSLLYGSTIGAITESVKMGSSAYSLMTGGKK